MISRCNYTNRQKILEKDVQLLGDPPAAPTRFQLGLPTDLVTDSTNQAVYVETEAAGSPVVIRHAVSWTDRGPADEWYSLGGIPWDRARFTIKVVSTTGDAVGRILKISRDIVPAGAGPDIFTGAKEQIIDIHRAPMVEQMWRLEFGERPKLVLNAALTMTDEEVTHHPMFRALVYPEICVRCLEWAIYEKGVQPSSGIPEGSDRASLWVKYALMTLPSDSPPRPPAEGWNEENRSDMDTWIQSVVTRICAKHAFLTEMGGRKQEAIK